MLAPAVQHRPPAPSRVWLLINFDTDHTITSVADGFQFREAHTWIESLGIGWKLGVDGISLFMVVLTGDPVPDRHHRRRPPSPRPQAVLAPGCCCSRPACLGVFLALDLFQFFVMFEVVLVPMYFLIGGWGCGERVYAANKFFLYTMLGLGVHAGRRSSRWPSSHRDGVGGDLTFDLLDIASNPGIAARRRPSWLFLGFAAAFAVKTPLFPLHTWLPDAHTEAPTAGSVILAGVMLKLGTYGFLRFGVFLFPEAARYWAPLFLTLGVIGDHLRRHRRHHAEGPASGWWPTRRSPTSGSSSWAPSP